MTPAEAPAAGNSTPSQRSKSCRRHQLARRPRLQARQTDHRARYHREHLASISCRPASTYHAGMTACLRWYATRCGRTSLRSPSELRLRSRLHSLLHARLYGRLYAPIHLCLSGGACLLLMAVDRVSIRWRHVFRPRTEGKRTLKARLLSRPTTEEDGPRTL